MKNLFNKNSQTVLLLYGGISGEHEVSCASAKFIFTSLLQANFKVKLVYITQEGKWFLTEEVRQNGVSDQDIHVIPSFSQTLLIQTAEETFTFDFVFSIIHGTDGEDGRFQGAMEFFHVPFAGSSMISSALSMDKGYMRDVFARAGLPQVTYKTFFKDDFEQDKHVIQKEIEENFQYPIFVKPCNMGSSVGVNKANNREELLKALQEAFAFDFHLIVEQGKNVREIELGILGNYPNYQVTRAGEIIPTHDFYSYDAKYVDADGARLEIPANLPSELLRKIQSIARRAFAAVHGDGFARVDVFVDKDSEEVLINEINTLPGFTNISMFPKLWQAEGVSSEQLVTKIIELGMQKSIRTKSLTTVYEKK